ncbi:putative glyoxylase CFP32 [Streptomyces sp. RB5]|uniref:Putative glyoxylase CFP32 n=1 Tax=Streptomyces smaragdinus TaxID=2585196 RepID=A0A7K0CAC8_9ACTN|nr:VOC family protein [Streptomyces smaragdinus]MQY10399.1 putative glyoxylase CFP32 [Streptomyces smaragdinus]
MAPTPDGTPIWADAMFPDLDGAKRFYGDLFGWTFEGGDPQYGGYTQALSDGKRVAAVVPQMPGMEGVPPSWTLYFSSADIKATTERIRTAGGTTDMEPMQVGEFGSMLIAKEPSGVQFGVWQPGTHPGFEKQNEPGSFAWAEVTTREAAKADAFFPAVFDYKVQRMEDDKIDFHLWSLPGAKEPALGRFRMTEDVPAEVPPYINVYFAVDDCDEAVGKVTGAGGTVHFGPMTSPFGRFATVSDPQGASFAVIDLATMEGDMPKVSPV